ncbi:MAG: hypothetical protein ACOH2J_17210 [Allorhizobium sp.]
MKAKTAVLALFVVSVPVISPAAESEPQLLGLLTLTGKCLQVVVGAEDFSKGCSGSLGTSAFSDGRTGFYFSLRSNHILTFSGLGVAGTGKDDDGFAIDRVIFNNGVETNKPKVLAATGRCTFGDPYKGEMTVRCNGNLAQGTPFSASFHSDGKPPTE